MNNVKNKVALVTGGASGIGKACCQLLAKAGATVIVSDIQEAAGKSLAEQILTEGGKAIYKNLDVTDESAWQSLLVNVCKEFGGLDILVNNAGIEMIRPLADLSAEDIRLVSSINIDGLMLGTKHAINAMTVDSVDRPQGGSVINISSVAGLQGAGMQSAYSMSKGAVRLFSKSAAVECCMLKNSVRVNSVHPGVIVTPMYDEGMDDMGKLMEATSADAENAFLSTIPMKQFGEPEDIAKGVLFLASDDSKYMTGSELVIDGGMTSAIYAG